MTCDSVDLPEPFGPMIACTSPGLTVSDRPWRISRSSTRTLRFLTSSNDIAFALELFRQFKALLDTIEAALDTRDINVIMFLYGQHSRHVLAHCRHLDPHGLHLVEQLAEVAADDPQLLQHETVRLNHQPTLPS